MQAAEPAGEGLLEQLEPELGVGQVAVEVAPPGAAGVAYRRQTQDLSILDRILITSILKISQNVSFLISHAQFCMASYLAYLF